MSDFDTILAQIHEQRLKPRPVLVRMAAVAGGVLAGLAGAVLTIPLPEIGVPLLLIGLRLLAFQFEWAARWYAHVAWRWQRLRAWWRTKPRWLREVVIWGSIAVIVLLVLWWRG